MFERGVEQTEGADDIGLDEGVRAVDRAVDMAFGGEVHDDVDALLARAAPEPSRWSPMSPCDEAIVGRVLDRA